ncbi:hypothetical protein NWE55_12850 [Myroides albus]|uniref:hypothetical protein n=1 Tax=Myroides albus TaxID=2562892 RepID=UPI0021590E26|nr:hypothetical protein [Myroides albus]UVD79003.1 hypothetical protein NWE55_12850 [Myroides albus]
MENDAIYKKILALAKKLVQNASVYNRADLAFELREFGIKGDSIQISALVWQAYRRYNNKEEIKKAFVCNDESKYLVEQYNLYMQLTQGNESEVITGLEQLFNRAMDQFNVVSDLLCEKTPSNSATLDKLDFMTFIGNKGVKNLQEQAAAIFHQYTNVVNGYEELKDLIQESVDQFVMLRDDIASMYRQYSLGLMDVFGDSIKQVAPDLFDFDKIQYLNTTEMFKAVEMEYYKLATSCGVLMEEIGGSFKGTLQKVGNSLGRSKGNKALIVLAVIDMVGHYVDAANKTTILEGELEKFKSKVIYDVALVNGDMKRLMIIHSVLNELLVPKAHIFYRYARQVMQDQYRELINSIYHTAVLQKLKKERDGLLEEYNQLSRQISDTQKQITYYNQTITTNNAFIVDGKDEYEQAKALKPTKPFLLFLGIGKDTYNREVYHWQERCLPVIDGYNKVQVSLKLDKQECDYLLGELKSNTERYSELHALLKNSNRKIAQEISVSDKVKLSIAQHLEDYLKCLQVGKDILQSKFDRKYLESFQLQKQEKFALNDKVKERLTKFTSDLKSELLIDEAIAVADMNAFNQAFVKKQKAEETYLKEDITAMMDAQNKLVVGAVDLIQVWTQLQVDKKIGERERALYEEQVQRMQSDFKQQMNNIGDKASVLREIMRQINTAEGQDEVKMGLLMLADVGNIHISAQDIEDLLNGSKTLEI